MVKYFPASIKDGQFKSDWQNFKNAVRNFSDGNYLLLLINTGNKDQRENQSKYFAIIGEWGLQFGYTKAEVHEIVKAELFPQLFTHTSTTDLDYNDWALLFVYLENFLILKFENR